MQRTLIVLSMTVATGLACSARTLTAVGPCPAGTTSVEGMACERPVPDPLLSGLVGLWHFDETAGATMAMDASENHNDGTLMLLDPATAWVGGRIGNALAVEATGYVHVPPSDSIRGITTAVTVSAWVYWEGAISDYGTALSRQIGTSIDQYYHLGLWQATDGGASLFITPSMDPKAAAHPRGTPIQQRTWTHLAGTYDGKVAILYVGGTPVSPMKVTGMFPDDTTPLVLGGNGNGLTVSEFFPGRIDEIALYNRALDEAEIQRLANAASF